MIVDKIKYTTFPNDETWNLKSLESFLAHLIVSAINGTYDLICTCVGVFAYNYTQNDKACIYELSVTPLEKTNA